MCERDRENVCVRVCVCGEGEWCVCGEGEWCVCPYICNTNLY